MFCHTMGHLFQRLHFFEKLCIFLLSKTEWRTKTNRQTNKARERCMLTHRHVWQHTALVVAVPEPTSRPPSASTASQGVGSIHNLPSSVATPPVWFHSCFLFQISKVFFSVVQPGNSFNFILFLLIEQILMTTPLLSVTRSALWC